MCPLIHSYFASWFVPSHQWVLIPFFQAPSGPSSPWTAALKGTDQRVALAEACPGARAGRGRGRLTSLRVPSGHDDTCNLPRLRFLPSSHPVLTLIPWGIWSNPASGTFVPLGLPVAPRPEAGVMAEPSATSSLGRYAGGSPPNYRLFVVYADGRSHRHSSPHLPAPVNHQRGLKVIHSFFKAIT